MSIKLGEDQSRDIVDLLVTVQSWLRTGIEIYAGDVGQIKSENDIMLVIKGWQGGDERMKIRERSMRGKRTKAMSGHVVGQRPPYGYRVVKDKNGKADTYEIVEEEARIVRLVFQWYVDGDENGHRLAGIAIARRLSEMHVSTPGERLVNYRRKNESGIWQSSAIQWIISNEVYAGVWHFGVKIGCSSIKLPPEEWIAVNVPPIIDRPTFEVAQIQKQRNQEFAKRNAKRDYLLSGLLRCGVCGSAYCGKFQNGHRHYGCNWYNNHRLAVNERFCPNRPVRADAIEADIWESVVNLFADTPELERLLHIAQQEELQTLDPKQQELEAIEGMIIEAEHEAVEIGQALKRAVGIVSKSLEHNMEDVNRRYDALIQRRGELQGEVNSVRLTDAAIEDAIRFAEDVRLGIENADFETKRRNLETLKVTAIIKDGRYYVSSLVGKWDGKIRKMRRSPNGQAGNADIANDGQTPIPTPLF